MEGGTVKKNTTMKMVEIFIEGFDWNGFLNQANNKLSLQ
jgi:hypothetical protein